MKKILSWVVFFALTIQIPGPAMARVDISVGISLPPPIPFMGPPEVIVLPDTDDVYAVPDIDVDLFFWNGWWWRLWEGRWYHSRYYDRGWVYYNWVPSFYFYLDPDWRRYYRDRNWYGHRWDYERIPYRRLQKNWSQWHKNRYWEKQRTWGIQGYQPRHHLEMQELKNQRREQYHQRPDVQRHQQQLHDMRMQRQQIQPQIQDTGRHRRQIQKQQWQPQPRQPGIQRSEGERQQLQKRRKPQPPQPPSQQSDGLEQRRGLQRQ